MKCISCLLFTGTVEKARKKAEDSQYTSAEDELLGRGYRKKTNQVAIISDSSSSEDHDGSFDTTKTANTTPSKYTRAFTWLCTK